MALLASDTIQVEGRTFSVEVVEDAMDSDLPGYKLTGKRGAVYFTMRNVHNRHRMFLINGRGRIFAPQTWLTDEGGTLRVH